MSLSPSRHVTGLLLSGGIDSSILLAHLLKQEPHVQPIYVRSDVRWLEQEQKAAESFVRAVACSRLRPLVTLDLPLADLYRSHWSITGHAVPDQDTKDDAVYLPGRNALLIVKAAIWCQLNDIDEIALATLNENPFPDAAADFFSAFSAAISLATDKPIRIVRPFEHLPKHDILAMGADLPLKLTFSCINPIGELHCGRCNKCAERQRTFWRLKLNDPTKYANRSI